MKRIKVLFLAADPFRQDALALPQEARSIEHSIRGSRDRSIDFETVWAVRVGDLQTALLLHRPDVVHFSGHGTDTTELILESDTGEPFNVAAAALSSLLAKFRSHVRLVVLNACFSAAHARQIVQHIDFCVGMKAPIGDEAAVCFAAAFYEALASGTTIRTAFELGRTAMMLRGIAEEDTPQLFTRADLGEQADGLLTGSETAPAAAAVTPPPSADRPPRPDQSTMPWRLPAAIAAIGAAAVIAVALLAHLRSSRPKSPMPDSPPRLFLQRVLEPPDGPIAKGTTVWLSATGDRTFTVDSLRVIHHDPGLMSAATGARPPDAMYFFEYEPHQDKTFALTPALVLNPADQTEVSFKLDVVPREVVGGMSWIELILGYHSSTGETGWLRVDAPTAEKQQLAALVGSNVVEGELADTGRTQVVTPTGNQRVLDASDPPALRLDRLPPADPRALEKAFPSLPNLRDGLRGSAEVNAALERSKRVDDALALLSAGQPLGFRLCAGLATDRCRQALIAHPEIDRHWSEIVQTLSFIHAQRPSNDLSEFIVAHPPRKDSWGADAAIVALTTEPRGRWAAALQTLAAVSEDAFNGLYLRLWDMDATARSDAERLAWHTLEDERRGGLVATKIVLQLGPSFEADLKRLAALGERGEWLVRDVGGLQLLADLAGIGVEHRQQRLWPRAAIKGAALHLESAPDTYSLSRDDRLVAAKLPIAEGEGRSTLWSRIESRGNKRALFAHADADGPSALLGIELLSNNADYAETRARLMPLCKDNVKSMAALDVLAALHLRAPTGDLASCYLAMLALNIKRDDNDVIHGNAIGALWQVREGLWGEALVQSVRKYSDEGRLVKALWAGLYDRRDELTPQPRTLLKATVSDILSGRRNSFELVWVARFARYFGMEKPDILRALRQRTKSEEVIQRIAQEMDDGASP